jgi:hypothetical protein
LVLATTVSRRSFKNQGDCDAMCIERPLGTVFRSDLHVNEAEFGFISSFDTLAGRTTVETGV